MINRGPNYCLAPSLPHLLCRYDSDPTDYSDDASGIFLSSIATVCTKGTGCSSMSIDTCSVSCACAQSTMITDSYATSNDSNSVESETDPNRSDFLINDETRSIISMRGSINNGSQTTLNSSRLNDATDRDNDEDSGFAKSLRKIPFITGPWVDSDNNKSMDACGTNNSDSNDYIDSKLMFPPSVPYLGENEEEKQGKELTA